MGEIKDKAALVAQFKKDVLSNFETLPNCDELLNFLIGCDIIAERDIKKFVIIKAYPRILEAQGRRKMRAIYQLEDATGFSDVYINSIITNNLNKYKFKKSRLK